MSLTELKKEIKKAAKPADVVILQKFFKTGKGEYGEGDIFAGIKVPVLRAIAKNFCSLELNDIKELIASPIHEERMISLFILIQKFAKADDKLQETIFKLYLKNTKTINNWDLVDLSAPQIVGGYLTGKERTILYKLAVSKSLWERRISMIATFAFIKKGDFNDTIEIAKILLNDKHDLIQKAVGWMLREIGKRDMETEEEFLKEYCKVMPRTMLRYAVEKFPEDKRKFYMAK
jgi:3-methyladenine DNA glycosylase AlkD